MPESPDFRHHHIGYDITFETNILVHNSYVEINIDKMENMDN